MRILDVYLGSERIGSITETRKGARFAYEPNIAAQHSGIPILSLSFPAKQKPFSETKTSNWFNGLLPEGPRRNRICHNLGLSPYDWIGLLSEIGWECAGAVRVFPRGNTPNRPTTYQRISESELVKNLSDAASSYSRESSEAFRMSLGGFQEKLCVCMPKLDLDTTYTNSDNILLPNGEAASTHILKPENEKNHPGSAESEAWAMLAARHAARCSQTALLVLEEAPATLVVERYDRAGFNWPQDAIRIHQEDACQALGLDPSSKYANAREPKGNDPTYKAIADLLIEYAENPVEELEELLRQMAINLALGNWDAHAKNISFLYAKPNLPTVAPLYDVVPIAEVEARTQFLSLRINGHIKPEGINGKAIIAEAATWGIAPVKAKEAVDECLEKLVEGIQIARTAYPNAAFRHEANALKRIKQLVSPL